MDVGLKRRVIKNGPKGFSLKTERMELPSADEMKNEGGEDLVLREKIKRSVLLSTSCDTLIKLGNPFVPRFSNL